LEENSSFDGHVQILSAPSMGHKSARSDFNSRHISFITCLSTQKKPEVIIMAEQKVVKNIDFFKILKKSKISIFPEKTMFLVRA